MSSKLSGLKEISCADGAVDEDSLSEAVVTTAADTTGIVVPGIVVQVGLVLGPCANEGAAVEVMISLGMLVLLLPSSSCLLPFLVRTIAKKTTPINVNSPIYNRTLPLNPIRNADLNLSSQ